MSGQNYHFIGIGGSGMSTIAHLFLDHGWQITGSDREGLYLFQGIKDRGVDVWVGTDPQRIPDHSIIVRSTAIRDTNPEIVHAREQGWTIMHRSEALALLAKDNKFIAVAGTHGKTTTSSMIASGLSQCDLDPSFAIGGVISSFGTGAHWGKGEYFVAEADESDRSFLNYSPTVAVINSVEPDHLDNYQTPEAYAQAYIDFVDRVVDGGVVVLNLDDPTCRQLVRQARGRQPMPSPENSRPLSGKSSTTDDTEKENGLGPVFHADRKTIQWWGYGQRPLDQIDVPVDRYCQINEGSSKANGVHGKLAVYDFNQATPADSVLLCEQTVSLGLPGIHNLYNLVASWLTGCFLGVAEPEMATALSEFQGAKRRFQLIGEVNQVRVYDDYAHHPTELEVLLKQARTVADDLGGRVLVLHQPHLFSRTMIMNDRFAQVLSEADLVVVPDICAAREDPIPGVTSLILTEKLGNAIYVGPMTAAATKMANLAQPKDIILVVGCGDINKITPQIVSDLEDRFNGQNK